MNKNKSILAVLAHPDDESFGMGGTLALYAEQGCNVHLACATRGEVGSVESKFLEGYSSIGEMREGELRCAAEQLGLSGVTFLGYRDSGMPGSPENFHPMAQVAHPVEEVAGKVVELIRKLKPDVILTFDPIGGYKHPDHIHIHNATVLAFEKSDLPSFFPEFAEMYKPSFLYFHTIPRGFLRFGVGLIRLFGGNPSKWGKNKDIDLASLAEVEFPTHVVIDYSRLGNKKTKASECHASQGGAQMRKGVLGWVFRLVGEKDSFMQAYPVIQEQAPVRYSLF